jgi:hypothetical protein
MYALAHSIPAMAKVALIRVVPSSKVGGGGMIASTLEALFTEHEVWLGKTFENAPRINVFIKITKKDNI